jgi:hypothetical protein
MLLLLFIFVLFIYFTRFNEPFVANINDVNDKECCIIKKVFNSNFASLKDYTYTKAPSQICNKTEQDSNTRILIDGIDGWNNKYCNINNPIIGSCHNSYSNHECVDFRTKTDCEKYNLRWDKYTCHNKNIPPLVNLNDRVSFKTNKNINQTNNLFPVITKDVKPHNTEFVWLLYPYTPT